MTTWEECSYVDDLLSKLVTYIPKEDAYASFMFKNFGYSPFDFKACGISKEEDLLTYFGLKKAYPLLGSNKDVWFSDQIINLVKSHETVQTGIVANYSLINLVYNDVISSHREVQFGKLAALSKTLLQVNLLGSLTTPKMISPMVLGLSLKDQAFRMYANLLQTASALQHLAFYWRSLDQSEKIHKAKRNNSPIPNVPRNQIDFEKNTTAYSFPGITMISVEKSRHAGKSLFILTNKQVRIIEVTLRALAKAIYYYMSTYRTLNNFQDRFLDFFDIFIDSIKSKGRENEVARAWDIIFNTELATIASDISTRSLELQREKLLDGKYDKIVSYESVAKALSGFGIATRLDLLKIYKILPAPDFNPSTGFEKMKAYHEKQFSYGVIEEKDAKAFPFISLDDKEFHIFQKLQLLRRLYRKYQYLPLSLKKNAKEYLLSKPDSELSHFPRSRPNHLTNEEIELINFKSEGEYEMLNTDSPTVYVDKACTPMNGNLSMYNDATEYYNEKIYHRNYAAWYMHQSSVPPTDDIRRLFANRSFSNNQMAFFKPEAKKPDPRNFYSATPYQRLCMTEFENNVMRYMSHDVASFQSKNPKERAQALSSLLGEENLKIRRRLVFISFDLEKFSPGMAKETKDASMRVWLEFFNKPHLEQTREFYNNVDLHFMHQGIHQTYNAKSIDMEGQCGKLNTCYHEDVMAYAVRLLRRHNLLESAAKLAVFIDDGLLALALPLDIKNEKIMEIVDIISMIYKFFGLRISFDKTFISSKLATFLNEVYVDNEYMNIGFKAILKLQLAKVTDELSISGKTRALVTMARASFVNGVLGHIVYSELIKELSALHWKTFQKIDRAVSTQETYLVTVLWIHTPVSMGGLGVPFLCNLEASPSTDPIGEFVCASEYLSGATPFLEPFLKTIVNQQFRQRSNLAIMRAPLSMRVMNHTLTEHKHISLLSKAVENFSNNPTLNRVLGMDFNSEADTLFSFLPAEPEYWEFEYAYKMSSVYVLDMFIGKFKRSSTLLSLLSWRSRLYLINKYKREESLVVDDFLRLYRK